MLVSKKASQRAFLDEIVHGKFYAFHVFFQVSKDYEMSAMVAQCTVACAVAALSSQMLRALTIAGPVKDAWVTRIFVDSTFENRVSLALSS